MFVNTVYFCAGDEAMLGACRVFYEETLGLTLDSAVPDHSVWFKVGQMTLGFHVGDPPVNPAAINIGLVVDDVEREVERLRDLGVPIVREPYRPGWATQAAVVADPAGHAVTLATPESV
jgi:predicted enzyme related to lactoylglutathione lyase